jgi:hypothetical protein
VKLQPAAAPPGACARCGAPFTCGRDDPAGCWCAALPHLPARALDAAQGCLCPACLQQALARELPPATA